MLGGVPVEAAPAAQASGALFERGAAAIGDPKGTRVAASLPGRALARRAWGRWRSPPSRPQIVRNVPLGRTSIILALDVSRSMCSTDVVPNRLSVAQAAAKEFVEKQPDGTRIGIVVFSGFAQLVDTPDPR